MSPRLHSHCDWLKCSARNLRFRKINLDSKKQNACLIIAHYSAQLAVENNYLPEETKKRK